MAEYTLYNEDNMEALKRMPDNSLDAVVTDAPYGLGDEPNALELIKAWADTGYMEIKGKGFMGKTWDAFVPQPAFWREVFRVLKPGGYVLCFFSSRTYDWGTLAIRLAGFEIRDCIQWIYGSGFPKSRDVSKSIDKAAGVERLVLSEGRAVKRMIPGADQDKTGSWIKDNGRVFVPSTTAPGTEEAKIWEGYGTALKPAYEPICVARKPLDGTVAENVLKHQCGAINLNGCRIGEVGARNNGRKVDSAIYGKFGPTEKTDYGMGRFPTNIILDEEAASILDQQSGVLSSGKMAANTVRNNQAGYSGPMPRTTGGETVGDSGGASRFFYCAKASTTDRDYGLPDGVKNIHPTVKPISLMRYVVRLVKTPFDTCTIADFFTGSGTTGVSCMLEGVNFWGCEKEKESYDIAVTRIEYAKQEYMKEQAKPKQQSLF